MKTKIDRRTTKIDRRTDELESRIQQLQSELAELRAARPAEEVPDYAFRLPGGARTTLSALFGKRDRLVLIHNMGRSCPFCTMWADGFNGLLPHLRDGAAFVVSSPDDPETQRAFAASRGWTFPMVSAPREFIAEMGFVDPEEGLMPGVSTFVREGDGRIVRTGRAEFGPGDAFCPVWHFWELFPGGAGEWEPRISYGSAPDARPGCHHPAAAAAVAS
jgi:predicted dithiol-disulfide oxidoreductase (DUF899 family)